MGLDKRTIVLGYIKYSTGQMNYSIAIHKTYYLAYKLCTVNINYSNGHFTEYIKYNFGHINYSTGYNFAPTTLI